MNPIFTQVMGEGLEEKRWILQFNTKTCKESPTFSVQLALGEALQALGPQSIYMLSDIKVDRCGGLIFLGLAWRPSI